MSKMELYTETCGRGPDLVLLHGWGVHSGIWQSLAPKLAQHHRVTIVDLPGFGHSPVMKKAYDMQTLSELLLEAVPQPAIWCGWSLGGMIATHMAASYPEQVKQLITVAASPKYSSAKNWPGMSKEALQRNAQLLKDDFKHTLGNFITMQFIGAPGTRTFLRQLKLEVLRQGKPDERTLLDGLKLLEDADLRPCMGDIMQPSLHIFGRLDALVPVAVTEKIQQLNPKARIEVMEKAGHAPFLSHEKQFVQLIHSFIHRSTAWVNT